MTAPLSPRDAAVARGRVCDLFGLTLLGGLSSELAADLRSLPGLSDVLPDVLDPDREAAEHHRVLQQQLRPMESLFLGSDGLMGGEIAHRVLSEMRADGLRPGPSEASDHLGLELAWLSHLLGAEADAHEDQRAELQAPLHERQRRVLDHHILRFLPTLRHAVEQLDSPVYSRLLAVLQTVLQDLRDGLPGQAEAWSLPPPPRPLEHPEHRLRDIAQWLCIPSRAGFYLSLPLLQKLGRELDIPIGFGRRVDCLENLLQGAVRYDRMPQLLTSMQQGVASPTEPRSAPASASVHAGPWSTRQRETLTGLGAILSAIQTDR